MATHDYIISNASGAAVRADLNNALAAIVSNNSNATSPATTYAFQFWADTTTGQLKIRNAANSAWITLMELDGTMLMEDGTVSAPGLAFASDTNTGFFRSAADKINFATGGAERLEIGSSEVVFNDPSNDVDFRVESNGRTHMIFVDAGNDAVGIGTAVPRSYGSSVTLATDNPSADNTFTIAAGTSNNASIHFADGLSGDDANRGIIKYEHNNNAMAFSTNASERLRIDNSGRLLIGVTSSYANADADDLQVGNNNASAESGISLGSTTGSGIRFADAGNASAGVIEYAHASDSMQLHTSGTERMRIDSSGRLLVGTSSDTTGDTGAKVQIVDTGTPVLALSRNDTSIVSGNTIGQIRIFSNDDSGYQECAKIAAQADGTFANNDKPTRLVFSTTASSGSSPTERMRIDSSGRLLVGTTSAVDSGATSSLQVVNTSTAIIALGRNDSSISAGNDLGAIRFYGNDGGSYQECAEIVAEADGDHANNDKPSRLVFSTTAGGASSSSERMRITSSGDVCINRTAPVESEKFSVQNGSNVAFFNCTTNSNVALMMLKHAYAQGSQTATQIQFRNDSNSTVGSITSTNSATAYNTSSDYRLKENVVDLDGAIARVKQLLPKRFNFIVNPETTVDGFLAHEAATVVPEAVTGTHNEVNSDNNPVYQGIDQSKLVPLLTAALQEAIAKIETLETKVAALEAG